MNVLNSLIAISLRMIYGAVSAVRHGRGRFLPYIAVAFISLLYCLPFMRLFMRQGDEGTLVLGALRITQGQVPFRDFFEVMAPGTFYWLALFFSLFGESWLTTRIYLTVTVVCTLVLLYYLARRLRTGYDWLPPVLFLAVGFPYWIAVSHHLDSTFFALSTLAAVLAWTDTQKPSRLLLTGALAGFTTCFMQPKGLLLILACLLTVAIKSRQQSCIRRLMTVLAGYAAVGLIVILHFAHVGALDDVVYANIVWPLTHYRGVNAVPYGFGLNLVYWELWTPVLQQSFSSRAVVYLAGAFLVVPHILVVCCPAILAASAISRPFRAFTHESLPYWTIGVAIWASELHRKDLLHLFWGSPVLIILILHLLHRERRFVVAGCIRMLCVSSVALATVYLGGGLQAQVPMVTPRGTGYTSSPDTALLWLTRNIRPGQDVFVYPYCPMYYYLSGANNPTQLSIVMYGMNTDGQIRDVIRVLEERKVEYVLWDTAVEGDNLKRWFPSYKHPASSDLIIEPYLETNYRAVAYENNFRILRRNEFASVASRSQPDGFKPPRSSIPNETRFGVKIARDVPAPGPAVP